MSRIWLMSMTVGNAGYPAKCALLLHKKKKKKKKKKKEIGTKKGETKMKFILNSIGVSC